VTLMDGGIYPTARISLRPVCVLFFESSKQSPPLFGMNELLPRPTVQFRRRSWREFQRALDPLGPPRPLPPMRASDSSLPSSSRLSNKPGETFDPVTAKRIG
jgi:hypothetical protein